MKKTGFMAMAILIVSMTLLAQQSGKSLTITGIPTQYGIYNVYLSNNGDWDSSINIGLDIIIGEMAGTFHFRNGTLTGELASLHFGVPFDGRAFSGSYFVTLVLIDNEDYAFETYVTKAKVNFTSVVTEIPFSEFNFVERTQGQ